MTSINNQRIELALSSCTQRISSLESRLDNTLPNLNIALHILNKIIGNITVTEGESGGYNLALTATETGEEINIEKEEYDFIKAIKPTTDATPSG